ncbi:MAG: NAD(P)H-dependent oxidoreductase [Alphaproteobacteria bacterium]|nr:NAD(P)H-dependent oxidoreductase [Alphaproteobacteria bacterium]
MKHAIIVGHPDQTSFTMALAQTYGAAVSALGHEFLMRDLYRMDFDPRLKRTEMPGREGWTPAADVVAERQMLQDVDVFAFVYPLWFNAPPAIVKGYIERVFGVGFGYAELHGGGRGPLLTDRQLIHVSASGSSATWLNEQGAWVSMRTLFEDYFGKICGMRVRPHIHFDSIVPGLAQRWVDENLKSLEQKVQEYFGDG